MMGKRGPKNPKNFWNDERRAALRDLFNASNKSPTTDQYIAGKLNEKFGSEFNKMAITSQRAAMGLNKKTTHQTRSSTKFKGQESKKSARLQSNDIVFKDTFRAGDIVYIPGRGVGVCKGMWAPEAQSAAAGTQCLLFVLHSDSSKRIILPLTKAAQAQIRASISKEQAGDIENILTGPAKKLPHWIKAKIEMQEKLASPDYRLVAELARDTMSRMGEGATEVTYSYQAKGREALALLAGEYALVMGRSYVQALDHLERLARAPKRALKKPSPEPAAA